MAHTYHWRQGSYGNGLTPTLKKTYDVAMADGKYDQVKHWVGSTVKHYAKTNPTEYFAETTEAFFSQDDGSLFRNDMYPFYREQLKDFDKDGFDMVASIFGIDDPEAYFQNLSHPKRSSYRHLEDNSDLGYNTLVENIGANTLLSAPSISNPINFLNP